MCHAQLHADVGFEAGASKRVLSSRPSGVENAGFGPTFELHGHLALLPLIRIGAYALAELSPQAPYSARRLYAGGVRLKLLPPFLRPPWRMTVVTGFGCAFNYAPSSGGMPSAWGRYLEVPLLLGASYRVWNKWDITLETGARFGFAFGGDLYARGTGNDAIGIQASLGVQKEF